MRVLMAAVVAFVLTLQSVHAQIRDVTVSIRVTDADGAPIADVPIEHVTPRARVFGFTDNEGLVKLVLPADRKDRVGVTLLSDGSVIGSTDMQRIYAADRLEELRLAHAWKRVYLSNLKPSVDQYSIELRAGRTMTIKGRLVDEHGKLATGLLISVAQEAEVRVEPDGGGLFQLRGLVRGEPAELVVLHQGQVEFVRLSSAQTADDGDVGEIRVPKRPRDVPVAVWMTNFGTELRDRSLLWLGTCVTFVSKETGDVYTFPRGRDGLVIDQRMTVPTSLPNLPAGDYYMVPGHPIASGGLALVRAVRAGRQRELDEAGVPLLVAKAGVPNEVTFDAIKAYEAVLRVAGDLIE